MKKRLFLYLVSVVYISYFFSCSKEEIVCYDLKLTSSQKEILRYIPQPAIIAHRGTCHWAPEGTEAAMRWARNVGATYLEGDLQRTKDGYLVIFHDLQLTRNSDIALKYPTLTKATISNFTLEELFKLDFGSWFNNVHPSKARASFKNLEILTLEDLIMIAEGYRIQRDASLKRIYKTVNGRIIPQYEPDSADNGNRPGIYIETKNPDLYPGIEQNLKEELEKHGWYADNISNLKSIKTKPGHIYTANTPARVIVQTFSQMSLMNLKQTFSRLIPMCYLIYHNTNDSVNKTTYENWIKFAIEQGAVIIGPCIHDKDEAFADLLQPWMYDLIKEKGLLIHAYTFKEEEQIKNYMDMTDGFFTDDADILLSLLLKSDKQPFYNSYEHIDGSHTLDALGY